MAYGRCSAALDLQRRLLVFARVARGGKAQRPIHQQGIRYGPRRGDAVGVGRKVEVLERQYHHLRRLDLFELDVLHGSGRSAQRHLCGQGCVRWVFWGGGVNGVAPACRLRRRPTARWLKLPWSVGLPSYPLLRRSMCAGLSEAHFWPSPSLSGRLRWPDKSPMIALADDCMGGDHDPRITPARRRCPRAHQFGAQWFVCDAMGGGADFVFFCSRHAKTITRPLWVRRNAYMPVAQVARDGADILWLGPCRHAGNRG